MMSLFMFQKLFRKYGLKGFLGLLFKNEWLIFFKIALNLTAKCLSIKMFPGLNSLFIDL